MLDIADHARSAIEIDEKLKHVSACQETLEAVWTRVTSYLQDELNIQLLKRDAADVRCSAREVAALMLSQFEAWMASQEGQLASADLGQSLDGSDVQR